MARNRNLQIVAKLSALALRPLLGDGADNLVRSVFSHLTDSSTKVSEALAAAQARSWRSLEVALAGPSWWSRAGAVLVSAEERAFRKQVEAFLAANPLDALPAPQDDFRDKCLTELRAAKKLGLLPGERLPPPDVPAQAAVFARYVSPQDLLDAEVAAVQAIAADLEGAGYPHLGRFVAARPVQGLPLLVIATRYFFRREVETDEELSRGLTYHQLDQLTREQEAGFASLADALTAHGDRLAGLLDEVKAVVVETREEVRAVRDLVGGARDDLADMRAQLDEQGRQMRDLMTALQAALARTPAPAPAAPAAAAPALDPPREQAQQLIEHCRALPAEQRQTADVVRIVRQLETVTAEYDRGRKTVFPFLREQPTPAAAVPAAPPKGDLKQVHGNLINESLFGPASGGRRPPEDSTLPAPDSQGADALKSQGPDAPSSPVKKKGRPISKLFQPKPDDEPPPVR